MVATPALTCAYDSHQSTSVQANSHSFVGVLWVLSMRPHRQRSGREHLGPAGTIQIAGPAVVRAPSLQPLHRRCGP